MFVLAIVIDFLLCLLFTTVCRIGKPQIDRRNGLGSVLQYVVTRAAYLHGPPWKIPWGDRLRGTIDAPQKRDTLRANRLQHRFQTIIIIDKCAGEWRLANRVDRVALVRCVPENTAPEFTGMLWPPLALLPV